MKAKKTDKVNFRASQEDIKTAFEKMAKRGFESISHYLRFLIKNDNI
jgi:predicted DNA binding CopG/RHH family protein